jgi:hypothetical protein
MIVIIKIKLKYVHENRWSSENAKVVWVYNSIDEAQHKGSQISAGHLERTGYKIMRKGKDSDQYVIDLGFKGDKDRNYIVIEKEIRPLFRERVLTDLLN